MASRNLLLFSEDSQDPAVIIPAANKNETTITLSFQRLHQAVMQAQKSIATMGIGPGSRVALAIRNRIEFVIVFLALIRQRAITSPVNPDSKLQESSELVGYLQPALTIVASKGHGAAPEDAIIAASTARHVPVAIVQWDRASQASRFQTAAVAPKSSAPMVDASEIRREDPVLLHYTSGTTGSPKAVALTHENIVESARIIAAAHELTAQDRTMLVAPFFHVGGTCTSLFSAFCSGGAVIIPTSLSGWFWHQFQDCGATWYHAVPTLHRLLLSFPRPTGTPKLGIRFIRSGGTSISVELVHQLEQAFECPVLEGYGMTETAQAVFCNRFRDAERRTAYYPIPPELAVKLLVTARDGGERLTDEMGVAGEICVQGKCVIRGYVDCAEEVNHLAFRDGYFRTGDLGQLCENGFLRVTGRIKEIINKGGEKISPVEIEDLILSHGQVKQVACFRVGDELYGEDIGLAIVPMPGATLKAIDIKKFVRQNATLFKVPKKVVFLESIPTNRTGKYLRADLTQEYGELE